MNRIANLNCREREELFLATSHDIKLPEAMVEKDFSQPLLTALLRFVLHG
jgi:hypothetical protein